MQFEIKNRWDGSAIYTCELSAEVAGLSYGLQLGFAVKQARASGADLRYANLSGADLSGADLRYADLRYANLRSADLSGANLRSVDLSGADLRYANLSGADLSGAVLSGADLSGADLSDADLRYANLRSVDLSGADLSYANLSGADLSGADLSDFPITIPDIHKAVYAAASKPGALDMRHWHHECGTTHCRAGWVITLAGDSGKALEQVYGTAAAAALIYQASDPTLERIPDFYCTNEEAMADMARLAGVKK